MYKFEMLDNMKLPKKIIFIITGLATGGAEIMLFKLCSKIDPALLSIHIISLSDEGTIGPRIKGLGIPVHALGMRPGIPSLSGLINLRKLVARLRPDLIQGWMYHGNLAAAISAGKVPFCWGIRQSFDGLKRERWLTGLVIWICAVISRFPIMTIYNSHISALQHKNFGFKADQIRVIPNGFDIDIFCPDEHARFLLRNEFGLGDTSLLIGLIGRFHEMKDHANFLNAAVLITKEYPTVHFMLVGSNVDKANQNLVSMIEERELSSRVLLLGERKDISRINAALDIATSSSAWGEGFANSIGEAMSCGVPCVVTDVGDSAWVVGEVGIVVPPRNSLALAAAWKHFIELGHNGRQAIGKNARKRIINHFSLGVVSKEYEDLYRQLITQEGM
jgi:glycosyltransferase involved in cell wall biosynthesis